METVHLPHLPQHPLRIALFTDVQNAPFLREQLLAGNTDYEYAFLDASVLLSRSHVLSACFRAINDLLADRLKTKNVHSEIVFAMNPNNNIAESFRRFGIQDDSKHIVAIKVSGDEYAIKRHLLANVKGLPNALTDNALASMHDQARIRKIYRLEAPKKGGSASQFANEVEASIIGGMALKGS